jgi:hypothetical protein
MPTQGGGTQPASKYYPTSESADAIPDDHRTALAADGQATMTTKSSFNRLTRLRPVRVSR